MVTEDNTEGTTEEVVEEIQPTDEVVSEETPSDDAVPVYEPNYAYKVYDEEREMDDWAKALIKDKETEEHLRSLQSKAGGFDRQKEEYGTLKGEHGDVLQQYNDMAGRIEELDHLMQNSPGLFFKQIGLNDDQIIEYVQGLLNQKDNPAEAARVQQHDQAILDSFQSTRQLDQLESQNRQLAKNSMDLSIDQAMLAPEISNLQRTFDSKLGAGAFRREVEAKGLQFHQANGYDTTGPDAVRLAYEHYKPMFGEEVAAAPEANARVDKPGGVIPNVGAGDGTTSPTKARFKSIDAIREYNAKRALEAG